MSLSLQEIFDTACEHLAKQKEQSIDDVGCLYRGPNGMKCAYGAFIPDEEYRLEFEGKGAGNLCNMYWYVAPAFRGAEGAFASDAHRQLALKLQNAHDIIKTGAANLREQITWAVGATMPSINLSAVNQITEWGGAA